MRCSTFMLLLLCSSCDRERSPASAANETSKRPLRERSDPAEAGVRQPTPRTRNVSKLQKELSRIESLEDRQEFGNALKALIDAATPAVRIALEAHLTRVPIDMRYNEGYAKVAEWYLEKENDLITASLWGNRITGMKGGLEVNSRLRKLYEASDPATRAQIDALPNPERERWEKMLSGPDGQIEPPVLPSSVGVTGQP